MGWDIQKHCIQAEVQQGPPVRDTGEWILYLGQDINLTRISKWTFISGISSNRLIVVAKYHIKKASEAISGPRGKIWEKDPLVKSARGRDKGNSGAGARKLDYMTQKNSLQLRAPSMSFCT